MVKHKLTSVLIFFTTISIFLCLNISPALVQKPVAYSLDKGITDVESILCQQGFELCWSDRLSIFGSIFR